VHAASRRDGEQRGDGLGGAARRSAAWRIATAGCSAWSLTGTHTRRHDERRPRGAGQRGDAAATGSSGILALACRANGDERQQVKWRCLVLQRGVGLGESHCNGGQQGSKQQAGGVDLQQQQGCRCRARGKRHGQHCAVTRGRKKKGQQR
jgi:hypothetical protein